MRDSNAGAHFLPLPPNIDAFSPNLHLSLSGAPPPIIMDSKDSDDDIEIISGPSTSALPPAAPPPIPNPSKSKKLNKTDTLVINSDDDSDIEVPASYINRTKSAPAAIGYSSDADLESLDDLFATKAGGVKGRGNPKALAALLERRSLSAGAGVGAASSSKAQGKGKAKALDQDEVVRTQANQASSVVPQKRALSTSDEGSSAAPKARKTSSKSPEKEAQRAQALALKASANELKKAHQKANNLAVGNKELSTRELTVHISGLVFDPTYESFEDLNKGKSKKKESPWIGIMSLVKERMEKWCAVEGPEEGTHGGAEGSVRWTRECTKQWDDQRKVYVPLTGGDILIVEEDVRLVYLTARNLSHLIATSSLLTYLQKIQNNLPSHSQILLMVYGLPTLYRSMKNAENALLREEVRERMEQGTGGQGGSKAKVVGIGDQQPKRDTIELELIKLQSAFRRLFIIQVDSEKEACDWIEQLSFDVGQKPYQRSKMRHVAALGLSDDKIISGKTLEDTYLKILSTIKAVTEPMARSILKTYPTLCDLFEAYEGCANDKARENLLMGIQKGTNKDGTATHRAIGKSLSKNIYEIMCGTDPEAFI